MRRELSGTLEGGADAYRNKILPLRARVEVRNQWLKRRLDEVLPEIMRREGFDVWLVIAREYNEDPVIMSLLPEPAMSARRRTILFFCLGQDGRLERLSLDRYGQGEYYEGAWDPEREEQYECLARLVRERNPRVIGANLSDTFAFGDGLTHTEHGRMAAALGEEMLGRVRGAERLALGWLERRTQEELTVYPGIVEIGHAIIEEAFSSRTIQPGITTTDDVVWWMRQKMLDLGFQAWFHPTVEIQAPGQGYSVPGTAHEAMAARRKLILPGDLLHCDVGFIYLGLATDQQQHAYLLRPGEDDAPEGLKLALVDGNRLQDILGEAMIAGTTGNEILRTALDRAREEGLTPRIYTHPIGYHGHGAGPTIGLWDQQDGVPGKGDYELHEDTCFSIELNAKRPVPEWDGQEVRIALEEDAVFTGGKLHWLSGRQTHFHLIG
jgi:Xaa-Pro aminopeptidase